VPIDFHAEANRYTYSGRRADESWRTMIKQLVEPRNLDVVDVGCGGGTYCEAFVELGARTVTGVDFSAEMLHAATEAVPTAAFVQGDAVATGLADACADVVFERALVHHVHDRVAAAREAHRILRPGGVLVIQDRTADDVRQPGTPTHPRGWFFRVFPRLLDVEVGRRPDSSQLAAQLHEAGFRDVTTQGLWEVRRQHPSRASFLEEIRNRTGRSILHELNDEEIEELVRELRLLLPDEPVVETDRWTVWVARA
jgi:ubiquinone/menaquinone biosynthesis C-methylase UbiE